MRNIVLCCDGTANEFAQHQTNVIKLLYALELSNSNQIAYYHPGLGTMEPPGALTGFAKAITRLLGKAVGYGLEADVRDAYVFLMNNFEPDDQVYLFGFSRGAYAVRVVASLLHMYGLVPRGNEPLVPYMVRMLTANDADRFELAARFKDTFSKPCKPRFVGVWDTVSSVGWISHPLKVPFTSFNPDVQTARQAVSIDEHRAFFRQNLWHPPLPPEQTPTSPTSEPHDIKQVWFPGVHCDVGGGYAESESGLARIALEWMLAEAYSCGLKLNKTRADLVLRRASQTQPTSDTMARMHNSLTVVWWPAEFVPKRHYDAQTRQTRWRMNLFRRRTIPAGSLIHESAFQRGQEYQLRLPSGAVRVSSLQLP